MYLTMSICVGASGISSIIEIQPYFRITHLSRGLVWLPNVFPWVLLVDGVLRVFNDKTTNDTEMQIDPDNGGAGIVQSMISSVAATIASLVTGHLHSDDAGTKELGVAQLASKFQSDCAKFYGWLTCY